MGFSKQDCCRDLEQFQLILDKGQLNLLAFSPVKGELECHALADTNLPVVEIVFVITHTKLLFSKRNSRHA